MNYVAGRVEEHGRPGRTGFLSSVDGYTWENPGVAFPVVALPEITPPPRYFGGRELPVQPEGTESVMHQRMGFYLAPNGRLLTSGFYSYCPNVRFGPNRGQGLGRVIREVVADGSLGPIYFVRLNRHAGWDEGNVPFPFYTESDDAGLVEACRSLLADKLVTLQWWEDDRGDDGFFTFEIPDDLKTSDLTLRPDSGRRRQLHRAQGLELLRTPGRGHRGPVQERPGGLEPGPRHDLGQGPAPLPRDARPRSGDSEPMTAATPSSTTTAPPTETASPWSWSPVRTGTPSTTCSPSTPRSRPCATAGSTRPSDPSTSAASLPATAIRPATTSG